MSDLDEIKTSMDDKFATLFSKLDIFERRVNDLEKTGADLSQGQIKDKDTRSGIAYGSSNHWDSGEQSVRSRQLNEEIEHQGQFSVLCICITYDFIPYTL